MLIAWAPTQISKIANPFQDIGCALRAGTTCDQLADGSGANRPDAEADGSDVRLMATPLADQMPTAALLTQLEQLAAGP